MCFPILPDESIMTNDVQANQEKPASDASYDPFCVLMSHSSLGHRLTSKPSVFHSKRKRCMLVSPLWIVQLTLCMFSYPIDTASPDYPNELSFAQGEILDIVDQGKWWQARKADDTIGSAYCCAYNVYCRNLTLC